MRFYFTFFSILSINLFFLSCTSSNENEKASTNVSISAEEKRKLENWESLSGTAKKILGSYNGVVRERTWGDDLSQLKEPFEKSESQPSNGISFTQYLDNTDLNFVDISYLGEENKLKEVKLDVFLENASEVEDLKAELSMYWFNEMGKNKQSDKKQIWEKNKTRIVLEDVSTSKDPGLQISFKQLP